jgi:predicted 3-demethylubiquinone-9 3-methyltransferase (glyoxalase superfamily)
LRDSKIDSVTALPAIPQRAGRFGKGLEFTLMGQPFMAISAGPFRAFNHAVSFMVSAMTRRDRPVGALSSGKTEQYGWLQDRYGLSGESRRRCSAR